MGTGGTTLRMLLFTFGLLWALITPLAAQQYNIKSWSLEEGLPQANITAIVQDKQGYLWLGTSGGLSKFNGIEFRNFNFKDGFSGNKVNDLFIDKAGKLWIATSDQGICSYDGTHFHNYTSSSGLPVTSITGGITDIAQAPDGTIWVSSAKGLAYLKNGHFQLLPPQPGLPARTFSSILIDRKGNFWLGTLGAGLFKFDGKKGTNYTLSHGLGNQIIYRLYESKNGEIWIGHYGGITKYTGKRFVQVPLPGDPNLNRAMAFAELPNNRLFIGMDGGGLGRLYNGQYNHFDNRNGMPSNYIVALLTDKEGNLWAGSIGGGLMRYTANGFTFYGAPEGLKNENVTAISHTPQNKMWLGTYGGGIARFDGEKFSWLTQKNGLASNNISDIKTDRKGNLWIATNQGLSFYNGKTFRNFTQDNGLIYNAVNYVFPERDNQVWVCTNAGLSFFDGKKFKNYRIPKSREANFINCIYRDRQNRLWLGTRAGIYQLKNGQFVLKQELQQLKLKEIQGIEQDTYGNLWFTAFNQGLLRYSPDAASNRFQLISYNQGLQTKGVSGLLVDSLQHLWIGTIRGLTRLNLKQYHEKQQIILANFGATEGLRGVELNPNAMSKALNGHLWFGTVKGLSKFNPFIIPVGQCEPDLNLLDIKLFLEETNWDSLGYRIDQTTGLPVNLKLKSEQNYLSFDYHAICLTNPEKVTYTHKLEGFDKTWSAPSNVASTTYSNLSPGKYIFKVRACTPEKGCTPKTVVYEFSIVPPFWSKDRIIGILVLAGALLAFGLARWREKNLIRLNNLLETKVEQRTRMLEKENHEKEILLKEVHHRVKNNLQIITSLLNLQTRHVSDPAVLDSIREIKDRIKSISMLHQRLYQREELAALDLSEYVQTLCRSLFASYGVSEDRVRLQFDIPPLNLDIDTALTLGLIVNELVSNTLKYAFPNQRSGTLLIELLRVTETEYTLTLSDDGTGLPDNFEEKMATSFGLQLVSSLIKKLQGKLKFYSEGGTQIRLQFVILPH